MSINSGIVVKLLKKFNATFETYIRLIYKHVLFAATLTNRKILPKRL